SLYAGWPPNSHREVLPRLPLPHRAKAVPLVLSLLLPRFEDGLQISEALRLPRSANQACVGRRGAVAQVEKVVLLVQGVDQDVGEAAGALVVDLVGHGELGERLHA